MNQLQLFLPCAAGVEGFLADEVHGITGLTGQDLLVGRGGVLLRASWRQAMQLNLHSRLAQRVLVQLAHRPYRSENDLYNMASEVAWEIWFTTRQTFKVEVTAQHSPLQSLNFAGLKVKDAVADRFRHKSGVRPDVNTQWPDVRVHLHLTTDEATIYIDTSGEPLFKRGWREDKGDAPLKETLAAAMIAASGWDPHGDNPQPLYDPCCGSGTIVVEAAQIACRIPAGMLRRFAFEKLLPFQAHVWGAIKNEAESAIQTSAVPIFGSDVAFRMVDFAQRNAERAGVAEAVQLRGGDALQRMPPCEQPGVMLLNPLWRANCRSRCRRPQRQRTRGRPRPGHGRGPRGSADRRRRRILQPTRHALEEELQRLDGLDAHARPQAARQDAPEGIAPRTHVERPHRMPHVPLRHDQGRRARPGRQGRPRRRPAP